MIALNFPLCIMMVMTLSTCWSLRIKTSPLHIYLVSLERKTNIIEKIYHCLDLEKPADGFINMFFESSHLPLRSSLQEAILNAELADLIYQLDHLEKFFQNECITLDILLEGSTLFHPLLNSKCPSVGEKLETLEALPMGVRFDLLSKKHLVLIITKLSVSPNLISTRGLCKDLTDWMIEDQIVDRKYSLTDNAWKLIDSHCLIENPNIAQTMLDKFLFPNDLDLEGMNGLEPIARLLQSITIRIMIAIDGRSEVTYDEQHHSVGDIVGVAIHKAYDKFAKIVNSIPTTNPLHFLYWCTKNYLLLFGHTNHGPPVLNQRLFADKYFEDLWSMFAKHSETNIQANRALVSILILLAGSHSYLEWVKECVDWIVLRPANVLPRKELFHLLIVLCRQFEFSSNISSSNDGQLYADMIDTLWNIGIGSKQRQDLLIRLYPQYFGFLYRFIEDSKERRAVFRTLLMHHYHHFDNVHLLSLEALWRAFGRISEITGMIFAHDQPNSFSSISEKRNGIEQMINTLLLQFFMPFTNTMEVDVICYVPRIEIHPYIELLFWNLIYYAILLKLTLPFTIHPAYVEYIFYEHSIAEAPNPTHLIQLLVANQYTNNPHFDECEQSKGAIILDAMYTQIWGDSYVTLDPTFSDFADIINATRQCNSFAKRIAERSLMSAEALEERVIPLKFMAFTIWASKKRKVARKLWIGSISDPIALTTLFFPLISKIPPEMLNRFPRHPIKA